MLDFMNSLLAEIQQLQTVQLYPISDLNIVKFEASGTYTKPNNFLYGLVFVTGGGGGSGGDRSDPNVQQSLSIWMRTGGCSGATGIRLLSTNDITRGVPVTVGAGGVSGDTTTSPVEPATNGGTSSFGSFVTATGGTKGIFGGSFSGSQSFPNEITDYYGGTAIGGDINIDGEPAIGRNYRDGSTPFLSYPVGADSFFGYGGRGGYNSGSDNDEHLGQDGVGYGTGGGLGRSNLHNRGDEQDVLYDGNGADGVVIIIEFLR